MTTLQSYANLATTDRCAQNARLAVKTAPARMRTMPTAPASVLLGGQVLVAPSATPPLDGSQMAPPTADAHQTAGALVATSAPTVALAVSAMMGSLATALAIAAETGPMTPLEAALDANQAALAATVSTAVHLVVVTASATTGLLAMANARVTLDSTPP